MLASRCPGGNQPEAGKVRAIVADIAGEEAVGLVGCMTAHQEIRDDVLPPSEGCSTARTLDNGLVPAPGTLHLLASTCGVALPRSGSLEQGLGREAIDADLEILNELDGVFALRETGRQLRAHHRANRYLSCGQYFFEDQTRGRGRSVITSQQVEQNVGVDRRNQLSSPLSSERSPRSNSIISFTEPAGSLSRK